MNTFSGENSISCNNTIRCYTFIFRYRNCRGSDDYSNSKKQYNTNKKDTNFFNIMKIISLRHIYKYSKWERQLTKDNHQLGTFNLDGIPPMTRGQPQIGRKKFFFVTPLLISPLNFSSIIWLISSFSYLIFIISFLPKFVYLYQLIY